MRRVKIRAIEVVKSIRAGMDDGALMERFKISASGLQKLLEDLVTAGILHSTELEERLSLSQGSVIVGFEKAKFEITEQKKPVIDALDALNCIREGIDETGLMQRYDLSAKGVQSLCSKLIATGAITRAALGRCISKGQDKYVLDDDIGKHAVEHFSPQDIDMNELCHDIDSGLSRESLMEKYHVSSQEFGSLLGVLAARGRISQSELDSKLPMTIQEFWIRHRISKEVIFSGTGPSLAALVEEAVSTGVDLSGADLAGTNLARSVLPGARLSLANLSNANLMGTDLTGAKLNDAVLVSANMSRAVLYKANLARADLSEADMTMVNGVWAFLPGANLSEVSLVDANLSGSNLAGANLMETILTRTNLDGAYLEGAHFPLM